MLKYDNYIAVDWSKNNMAIASMKGHTESSKVIDVPTDIYDLKAYLGNLKGTSILTIEESTPSQWLYMELKDLVTRILICNPSRNKLLSEGAKTDKIDAKKLVVLLRAGLLKEVYHSGEDFIRLRKLVRGYISITKNGVRLKNQRSALLLSMGKMNKEIEVLDKQDKFILSEYDKLIANNDKSRTAYTKEFKRLERKNKIIKNITTMPGIDTKGAVKLAAIVVDGKRFKNKSSWLSYCGLVKHEKISGGKVYGRKNPNYSRLAKSIFKTAAVTCLRMPEKTPLKEYYNKLIKEKNYTEFNARHALARRIAILTLGIMKSGKGFENRWSEIENKSL